MVFLSPILILHHQTMFTSKKDSLLVYKDSSKEQTKEYLSHSILILKMLQKRWKLWVRSMAILLLFLKILLKMSFQLPSYQLLANSSKKYKNMNCALAIRLSLFRLQFFNHNKLAYSLRIQRWWWRISKYSTFILREILCSIYLSVEVQQR